MLSYIVRQNVLGTVVHSFGIQHVNTFVTLPSKNQSMKGFFQNIRDTRRNNAQ